MESTVHLGKPRNLFYKKCRTLLLQEAKDNSYEGRLENLFVNVNTTPRFDWVWDIVQVIAIYSTKNNENLIDDQRKGKFFDRNIV